MKLWKRILFVIFILCILIGVVSAVHTEREKYWLQQNIDHIFTWNFSQLNATQMLLALNPDMTEQERDYYQDMITKYGYTISQLFSSTSYRESVAMNVIVGLLDQATGTDAINDIRMTEELNHKLTELQLSNFSDETKISEALTTLKNCIITK
ncbi:MAG: hypothetical protein J6A61_03835 [Clostridia bacterium]|nr:hypothetical protein [Clostridia bacterium]